MESLNVRTALAIKICDLLGTLLFAYQIDGCSQEVCSHILSLPPAYAPSLSRFEMGHSTKYLMSIARDNFQLVLVKTDGSHCVNIESKVLSIHLIRIFCITKFLNLLNASSEHASVGRYCQHS